MALSDVLSELRKDKHLRQKDLADYLNISVGTISNYETGAHEPDFETLCRLAEYFHVSTDYLLGRTDITYDMQQLSKPIRDGVSVSHITHAILSLDDRSLDFIIDYLDLLTYRSQMIAERNEYNNAGLKLGRNRSGLRDDSPFPKGLRNT